MAMAAAASPQSLSAAVITDLHSCYLFGQGLKFPRGFKNFETTIDYIW